MKTNKVRDSLEMSLDNLRELIKATKGEKSTCGIVELTDIDLYLNSWVIPKLEWVLEEVKK